MPRCIPTLTVTPSSPDTSEQHRLTVFEREFGINTAPAAGLTGRALTDWLDAAEDTWITSALDAVLATEPSDTDGGAL